SAAYNALLDLGLNCTPAQSILDPLGNIPTFRRGVNVIKVENYRVAFSTVHARVAAQVLQDSIEKRSALHSVSRHRLSHVVLPVAHVVLANVLAAAFSAIDLSLARRALFEVERTGL